MQSWKSWNRVLSGLAVAASYMFVFGAAPAAVQAADVFWDNAAGGNWSDDTNWTGGAAPGAADNAFITLDGTYTVTLDVNTTVAGLTLGAASGTQTLEMVFRTLTLDGSSVVESNGVMDLRGSTITINAPFANEGLLLAQGSSTIGSGPGDFGNPVGGTIRVEGSGAAGSAILTVTNGFTNAGLIELTAINSNWGATLNVTNGTLVNMNTINALEGSLGGARTLGAELDNQGTINIEVATSINKSGAADHTNSGTINVTGGDLTLSMSQDTFTNTGTCNIADGRTLHLNGGIFTNFNAGTLDGGTYNVVGTFKFTGADIVANAATIVLDGPDSQILDQSNNDALANFASNTADGSFTIINGRDLTTPGAFANGGDLTAGSASTFSATGDYTQTGGTTTLDDGTVSSTGLVDVQAGQLRGIGTVDANMDNAGLVGPGFSPGMISVTGDLNAVGGGGGLNIEIGGLLAGDDFDILAVDGAVTLAGTISVTLIDGFEPMVGDSCDILTATSISGMFDTVNLAALADRNCFELIVGPTEVTLIARAPASISVGPESKDVCEGDPVTFSVTVEGFDPIGLQWRFEGVDISGATAPSYTIDSVTPADAGQYDVVATNICATVMSEQATLTVNVAPAIITHPVGTTACEGDPVTFSVTAEGLPDPTFQWRLDGVDIPDEMGDTINIGAVSVDDAGIYDVVVANECGTVVSDAAPLTVLTPTAGDFDLDCDVDLLDHAAFPDCISGPDGGLAPGCEPFDFDQDNDVDLADWGAFQIVFNG